MENNKVSIIIIPFGNECVDCLIDTRSLTNIDTLINRLKTPLNLRIICKLKNCSVNIITELKKEIAIISPNSKILVEV
jgi:hypothetical protein